MMVLTETGCKVRTPKWMSVELLSYSKGTPLRRCKQSALGCHSIEKICDTSKHVDFEDGENLFRYFYNYGFKICVLAYR
jgi:hypothetical protein